MGRVTATLWFIYHLPRLIYYALRTIWHHEKHGDEIERKSKRFNESVDNCDDCSGMEFCDEHYERLMELKDEIGQ